MAEIGKPSYTFVDGKYVLTQPLNIIINGVEPNNINWSNIIADNFSVWPDGFNPKEESYADYQKRMNDLIIADSLTTEDDHYINSTAYESFERRLHDYQERRRLEAAREAETFTAMDGTILRKDATRSGRRGGKTETAYSYAKKDAEVVSFMGKIIQREPVVTKKHLPVEVTVLYETGSTYTRTCDNIHHALNWCRKALREHPDITECAIDNTYEWTVKR